VKPVSIAGSFTTSDGLIAVPLTGQTVLSGVSMGGASMGGASMRSRASGSMGMTPGSQAAIAVATRRAERSVRVGITAGLGELHDHAFPGPGEARSSTTDTGRGDGRTMSKS
jgi:hypothetical protein